MQADGKTNNPNRPKTLEGNQIKSFDNAEETTDAMLPNINLKINLENCTQFNCGKEKSYKNDNTYSNMYSNRGCRSGKVEDERQSLVRKRISDIFLPEGHKTVRIK